MQLLAEFIPKSGGLDFHPANRVKAETHDSIRQKVELAEPIRVSPLSKI